MYLLACNGELTSNYGSPQCSSDWMLFQLPEQFDFTQLDPLILGQMFGIGFSLVGSVLVVALGAKALLDFIKRG
ncbi:hypothetical protein LX59_01582 [Azomonas agilis]|uniref:Uncharacterized protein n=1 Tax=Azomonas agilis TaxID=116849 RepID=A0A562IJW7_9GAMM|nr:hypothetical protein LX59_01582 [Azomonas agilis]